MDASNGKNNGLPADAESEPTLPDAESLQPCVLLVEDEALIAEIVGEVLTEQGYAVHAVANASDALAHLSNGARVDLLFTDINLPGDVDGVDLAVQARGLHPELPVIYASGRWGRLDELRGQPRSAILRKPYSAARACSAVDDLIAAQTPERKAAEPAREAVLAS